MIQVVDGWSNGDGVSLIVDELPVFLHGLPLPPEVCEDSSRTGREDHRLTSGLTGCSAGVSFIRRLGISVSLILSSPGPVDGKLTAEGTEDLLEHTG